MDDLIGRRMVVVTGKGGVGKTTVAAALGLLAARSGRRTMICEVAHQERITSLFGRPPAGFSETEVAPGLFTFSVNPEDAKEEWLRYQLRSGTLAGLLGGSRIFQYLTAAAPGLSELVTLGKIWELAQLERLDKRTAPYDLVIVDAPATGHGIALLRAPRTFGDVARVGPIRRQAGIIESFVTDPGVTAVVAVALAEEMPVNETVELEGRLRDELGIALARVVVNAVLPQRFSTAEADRMTAARESATAAPSEALGAALAAHGRAREQRSQVGRLRRGVQAPVATLSHLLVGEVEAADVDRLSHELEQRL